LREAHSAGVTGLVECSTVGDGRNLAVLRHLAEVTPIHIVAPTGGVREFHTPPSLRETSAQELAAQWAIEPTEGIEGSPVRAGFIKIAMSDDGPTALEMRNLKAAALASREMGAAVASHTTSGAIARRELEFLAGMGFELSRLVWVHANLEPDTGLLLQAARAGSYVSLDAISAEWRSEDTLIGRVLDLIEAGCGDRILLSQDGGWYDPAEPDGRPAGGIRGCAGLVEEFVPALRARGVTDDQIRLLTVVNPARALALSEGWNTERPLPDEHRCEPACRWAS